MIPHTDNCGKGEGLAVKGNELNAKSGDAVCTLVCKLMFVPLVV